MRKTEYLKVLICAAFFALPGCDSGQNDVKGKINTIKIVEIQPPLSEPLMPGQKVVLDVKLAYDLQSKAAVITLAALRPRRFGYKSLGSNFATVQQGKGNLEMKLDFIVPGSMEIVDVQAMLSPQQRNDSAPVVKQTYKVVH